MIRWESVDNAVIIILSNFKNYPSEGFLIIKYMH